METKDLIVIGDHYNCNPSSLEGGLEFAANLATEEGLPLRLVLGDMLDLGEETTAAHRSVLPAILKRSQAWHLHHCSHTQFPVPKHSQLF